MWQMNWNRVLNIFSIMLCSLLLLTGCSSEASLQYADNRSDHLMIKKIEQQYQIWQKTPYRYGGNTLKGIDCSGLARNFYNEKVNIVIPRVTTEQSKLGEPVTNLKAGDLVFFKTGRGDTGLHVGIYYKDGRFLHVSTSKGVQFASLDSSYWKKRYWLAKRVVS